MRGCAKHNNQKTGTDYMGRLEYIRRRAFARQLAISITRGVRAVQGSKGPFSARSINEISSLPLCDDRGIYIQQLAPHIKRSVARYNI